MTRDEILAKEPGRELDALVAAVVLKNERAFSEKSWNALYRSGDFHYSTDISAAWEVVEELNGKFSFNIKRLGDYFYQDADYGWQALFTSREALMVTAQTAPEAICKAALLAVMDGINQSAVTREEEA